MFTRLLSASLACAALPAQAADPIRPVAMQDVQIGEGFWRDRLETNRKITLPHVLHQCESTGRIDNFGRAAGTRAGAYEGFHFNDSDVYKLAEAMGRSVAGTPDRELQDRLDRIVATIASAQKADGYIHPFITLEEPDQRWKQPQRHELFSIGHLIEAGADIFLQTGDRALLEVAVRAAQRVEEDFNPGTGPLTRPPEHQQIEIGLVRLTEATGDGRYLSLAKRLLDARGRGDTRPLMGEYCQDHAPVARQAEAVGHAVRALYQYVAMADVARHSGDTGYLNALEKLWEDVVHRKTYVTGGVGSSGGNEGFGAAYDLPNSSAYSETCAAIASIMWNDRMFRLTGDGRFADIIERTLYNALLSGVSLSGDRFFYPNRLESFRGASRSEWFDCSCCPTNLVRFLPSVPGLAYAATPDALYVNQYINSSTRTKVGETLLKLRQESGYPWSGQIRIEMDPGRPRVFALKLRIPDWARGEVMRGGLYRMLDAAGTPAATIRINGEAIEWKQEWGYACIRREWQPGDRVDLELPMPVRRLVARDEVVADVGRVALQRGPVVYCAEGLDQEAGAIADLMVEDGEFLPVMHDGLQAIRGPARQVVLDDAGVPAAGEKRTLLAIPYFAWANRGPTPMQVWLARTLAAARPAAPPTLASTSKVTTSGGSGAAAIHDLLEPRNSGDHSLPFFHWWPRTGTTEWVQYDFPEEATVTGASVYWFDDRAHGGGCRTPRSWRILFFQGDEWHPVENREVYTTGMDRWSRVSFRPVTTSALRLEVELPEAFSAGIHEWTVEPSMR